MSTHSGHPIELRFPLLAATGYLINSVWDAKYNCIAWAAGRRDQFWWPIHPPGVKTYWPDGVRRELSLEAFINAYESIGFERCPGPDLEPGLEKVAIYACGDQPTHAARQLADGRWTSKLGKNVDIEHNVLAGLNGTDYGRAVAF